MLMKNLTRLVVTDQAQTPQPKQYFENMCAFSKRPSTAPNVHFTAMQQKSMTLANPV